ncbi:MAG TPA: thiamine pyrophosphate-dependent dehydrogenase E1 component subunit alpha [Alphaproteobacteria bacterium]|nr:thiamine pyrophosphate-dependent dehydrogenase E1 component subunit alpha [Alphaproteobacteria bacterium]
MARAAVSTSHHSASQLDLYRTMATIRAFEETVQRLFLGGHIPGLVHLYMGQEAVAAGVCAELAQTDFIASHHRGHGHCVAKGGDLDKLFAELLGKRAGYGLGRGGSMHIFDPENGNLGTTGIVGGSVPLAAGAALTAKLRKTGQVAVSFFGDGVLNQGIMFETMNMAAIWNLPVLFVCENNGFGEYTAIDDVTAGKDIADRGKAFAIPSEHVDGMDVLAMQAAARKAVERARGGEGPSFLICSTWRYSGHHIADKQEYKEDEATKAWRERDPLNQLARKLIADKSATQAQLDAIMDEAKAAVTKAAEGARKLEAPSADMLMEHLYAE